HIRSKLTRTVYRMPERGLTRLEHPAHGHRTCPKYICLCQPGWPATAPRRRRKPARSPAMFTRPALLAVAALAAAAAGLTGLAGPRAAPAPRTSSAPTSPPPTPPPAPACHLPAWQPRVQGKPLNFAGGERGGDYLWHNASGFHLAVTHRNDGRRVYRGEI